MPATDADIRAVASRMKDCLPGARDDPRRSVSRVEVSGRPTIIPSDDNRRSGMSRSCVLGSVILARIGGGPDGELTPRQDGDTPIGTRPVVLAVLGCPPRLLS